MTRRELIESVYQAASREEPAKRSEFLAKVCQGDDELRREVETLLGHVGSSNVPTCSMVAAGTFVGPYKVEALIGAGGMGEVYRAVDTRLGRKVALKFTSERFQKRFEREARMISSLNHPHICTLYDIGPNYLVMEFVDGETIASRLSKGSLPSEDVRRYGSQIAAGLAEAHGRGVIHRDLKPGNIMIAPTGVKILDFGLAKGAKEEDLTGARVMGTPGYMSPEQRSGQPADVRSDIYSFGCVLYEMLTNKRPTSGRQPLASPYFEKIVSRCLAQDPANRWQSAAELARELERTPPSGARFRAIVALMSAALLASAFFILRPRSAKLTEKDSVVLGDIANNTGDQAFNDILKSALSVSLKQSPFLDIVSEAQVSATLTMMTKPPSTGLTSEVAREVCVRRQAKAYITGVIAKLGSNYAISLKATNCANGDSLADELTQAATKEKVIDALGQAASKLRSDLGESLSSLQKYDVLLSSATTGSLDALKEYDEAGRIQRSKGDVDAIPYYRRAIELDPDFALAYEGLAICYMNLGESQQLAQALAKARELQSRTSRLEQLIISTLYFSGVTGEFEKARQILEIRRREYPRDLGTFTNLTVVDSHRGQWDTIAAQSRECLSQNPSHGPCLSNLAIADFLVGHLDTAAQTYQHAVERKVDRPAIHRLRYLIAYAQADTAEMQRQIDWAAGKAGAESGLLAVRADLEGRRGRVREARRLSSRAVQLDSGTFKESAAETAMDSAVREAEFGNFQQARQATREALSLASTRPIRLKAALVWARTGDTQQALAELKRLSEASPLDTSLNDYWKPVIQAAVAVQSSVAKASDAALEQSHDLLQRTVPYELGMPSPNIGDLSPLYPVYLRGEVYLRLRSGAEALAEFEKFAKVGDLGLSGPLPALARLGAARSCALTGATDKARTSYREFLTFWKDADSDLPVLKQAKAELAGLR